MEDKHDLVATSRYERAAPRKQCTRCKSWLSFDAFGADRYKKDGRKCWCYQCLASYQNLYGTPEWHRKHDLYHRFRITPEHYARLLAEQGGVCAACRMPETHCEDQKGHISALCVHRDYQSGDIAALLCHACNTALGSLDGDPARIRALADYAARCRDARERPKDCLT